VRQKTNKITTVSSDGRFQNTASKLYESFVSNQWFGSRIKLPKSRELLKLRNTYDVTKPHSLKSHDFGEANH